MKKILLTILLVLSVTISQSQSWDTSRHIDNYRSLLFNVDVGYEQGIGMDSISRVVTDISIITNPEDVFGFGIGTGIRYYPKQEMTLLPFFVEVRGYPFSYRKLFLPYISLKLGHSFNINENFTPVGWMMTPGFGVMYENRKYKFYSLSITYSYQEIQNDNPPNDNYNGIGLNLGYTF